MLGPGLHGTAFKYSKIARRSWSVIFWCTGQGMTCRRLPLKGATKQFGGLPGPPVQFG